ncbi:TonB-dependent receptor domain-containing protein [Undibacterium flavidum]|uniref:TonB-dependent receptor n=1 Tax=Undibacterium flavidum TaxID=2762297 RepID=A0ABR6Y8Q0_9BURK|nr:TonB-dependent receptor [Undibacterium flavidum]MBC3872986.1 TonB-dependent receptor [Undibacterium flavidum]
MLTRKNKLKKKILLQAITLTFSNIAVVGVVQAQDNVPTQKVEVTGSSIKRIASEGALPIQTITAEMIERSGATSMPELLQSMPIMQDVWTKSAGVGASGQGNGIQNANLHGIGSNYTLTLVNGRRMAAFGGGGNSSDLNAIPLSAIERVEILTDGASAIYGSDAVGGVINFILKKNATFKTIEANINRPTQGVPGTTKRMSATFGFGDIATDKYNIILGISANDTSALDAKDRKFSNTGIHPLSVNGKPYAIVESNVNSSPANLNITTKDKKVTSFNPVLLSTGSCPVDGHVAVGDLCRFDFAHVVQLQGPEKEHKIFSTMNFDLAENLNFYVDAWISKNVQTPEYAPPAGSRTLTLGSPLYNKYVLPNLQKYNINPTNVTRATYTYRLMDAGRRGVETEANARHLALGFQGNLKGWDYDASYTISQSLRINNWKTGFLYGSKYNALIDEGKFDPFAVPNADSKSAMSSAVIREEWYRNRGTNSIFNARASRPLFDLPGGAAMISVGGEHYTRSFVYTPTALGMGRNTIQPNYTETILGGDQGLLPTDAKRKTYAFFSELFMPVRKDWEVSGAFRFDHADKIHSNKVYDPDGNPLAPADVGKSYSGITYKLSTAFRPISNLLLRASIGSSFTAPSLYDITDKLDYSGTTSAEYPCPITKGPLLQYCEPGNASYGVFYGGNSSAGPNGLKAERARQFTAGFRYEPNDMFSIGFDWYKMKIRDQILTLSSTDVFTRPQDYQDLFRSWFDTDENKTLIAAQLVSTNRYSSLMQGIDWDHSFKTKTAFGALKLAWTGTYAMNNEYQYPGKTPIGQIANADNGGSGLLRWSSMLTATLYVSNVWSHMFSMKNTAGYHDRSYTAADKMVLEVLPNGTYGPAIDYKSDVGRATIFNWQTRAVINKNLSVSVGVKNLLNTDPLFSISTLGDSRGFNSRLASPLGRQINLVAKYTF